MARIPKDGLRGTRFHDAACIKNQKAIRNLRYDAEIVSYENQRESEFAAKLCE